MSHPATVTMPVGLARAALDAIRDLIRESHDPGSGALAVEWELSRIVEAAPPDLAGDLAVVEALAGGYEHAADLVDRGVGRSLRALCVELRRLRAEAVPHAP